MTPRLVIGAGLLAVGCAAPVRAQALGALLRDPPLYELAQAAPAPAAAATRHAHDDTAMWVYLAAISADWSVTAICAKFQCAPNHFGYVRGVEQGHQTRATVLGLVIDGTLVYGVREWVQPDHPKIANAILYGLSVFRTIGMTHKASDLRRNTTRSAPPGT